MRDWRNEAFTKKTRTYARAQKAADQVRALATSKKWPVERVDVVCTKGGCLVAVVPRRNAGPQTLLLTDLPKEIDQIPVRLAGWPSLGPSLFRASTGLPSESEGAALDRAIETRGDDVGVFGRSFSRAASQTSIPTRAPARSYSFAPARPTYQAQTPAPAATRPSWMPASTTQQFSTQMPSSSPLQAESALATIRTPSAASPSTSTTTATPGLPSWMPANYDASSFSTNMPTAAEAALLPGQSSNFEKARFNAAANAATSAAIATTPTAVPLSASFPSFSPGGGGGGDGGGGGGGGDGGGGGGDGGQPPGGDVDAQDPGDPDASADPGQPDDGDPGGSADYGDPNNPAAYGDPNDPFAERDSRRAGDGDSDTEDEPREDETMGKQIGVKYDSLGRAQIVDVPKQKVDSKQQALEKFVCAAIAKGQNPLALANRLAKAGVPVMVVKNAINKCQSKTGGMMVRSKSSSMGAAGGSDVLSLRKSFRGIGMDVKPKGDVDQPLVDAVNGIFTGWDDAPKGLRAGDMTQKGLRDHIKLVNQLVSKAIGGAQHLEHAERNDDAGSWWNPLSWSSDNPDKHWLKDANGKLFAKSNDDGVTYKLTIAPSELTDDERQALRDKNPKHVTWHGKDVGSQYR